MNNKEERGLKSAQPEPSYNSDMRNTKGKEKTRGKTIRESEKE
jgi:hypothetical protein